MMKRESVALSCWAGAILFAALAGCGDNKTAKEVDGGISTQALVDSIGTNLQVNVTILDNAPTKPDGKGGTVADCPDTAPFGLCFSGKLVLTNTSNLTWAGGFTIYYSSIRKVLSVDTDQFTITHVNGDLHKIEPTAAFTGWPAGQAIEIPFKAEYWLISETDVMPRFYVVADGAQPALIKSTDVTDMSAIVTPLTELKVMQRTPGDKSVFATAESRFTDNVANNGTTPDLGADAVAAEVIPAPLSLVTAAGTLDLAPGIALDASALGDDVVVAVKTHFRTLGIAAAATGIPVKVTVDPAFTTQATAEAYSLQVTADGVTIVGGDRAGAFYGLQTLAGLVPATGSKIPLATVVYDAPRYAYRGVQIDLARNFHSMAEILKVIDQAAAYKLNSLHLHLSDDEGWRLDIPDLPELTTVGSQRCFDPTEQHCLLPQLGSGPATETTGTGHLSVADFVAILASAKAHFIDVIPEFDMPGHVRAAIKSMEARAAIAGDKTYLLSDPSDKSVYLSTQYYSDNALNPCLESTFAFVGKVMDEVKKMYDKAGATLRTWHVGGDEVGPGAWTASPACAALYATGGEVKSVDDVHGYFIRKVNVLAARRGFGIRGWSDGLRKSVTTAGTTTKVFLDIATDLADNAASVNWWGTLFWWDNAAYELANAHYKVILTSPDFLYLDQPYEADPKERGYYWATRFTDVHKLFSYISGNLPANSQLSVDRQGLDYKSAFIPTAMAPKPVIDLAIPTNVVGLEGAQFSETVRSDDNVDYMVFPRLLALAERAWHRAAWEPTDGTAYDAAIDTAKLKLDWNRFANLLGHKELPKLDKAQVAYRIEVPGAQIVSGKLTANVATPGLTIQYQDAGGTWTKFDPAQPPAITSTQVRAITASGRPGRAVAVPAP